MLNENIKAYRKQKGFTQETLAQELNVVRQTVSKWEKGYSVPDAVMLERMAELFEISVGDLLGSETAGAVPQTDLDRISAQLSVLNNQFARELARKRKIRNFFKGLLIAVLILAVFAVGFIFSSKGFESVPADECQPDAVLANAITKTILDENADGGWMGECPTASFYVYGTDEKDGEVTVYLLESFNSFGFKNGFFVPAGGQSGPAVFRYKRTVNSCELLSTEYAEDGEHYAKSVRKMFPFRYERRVLNDISADKRDVMWLDTVTQAQKYLEGIERKAQVCEYGEIKHTLYSDLGISTEVSNKLVDMMSEYDYEIGNHEVIENGVRLVYQTDYDEDNNRITFTKFEYATGKVIDFTAASAETGEIIKNAEKPAKASYKKGMRDSLGTYHNYTTVVVYE